MKSWALDSEVVKARLGKSQQLYFRLLNRSVWRYGIGILYLLIAFIFSAGLSTCKAANTAPVLASIQDQTIPEGRNLVLTNSATDADVPPQTLIFTLGFPAPPGATISSNTGVFHWRPNEIQGGTNYDVAIIVVDNGTPSLSATQHFLITVMDTLPDFSVTLGNTNLLANETGAVSIVLNSRAGFTNVTFILEADTGRLRDFALISFLPPGDSVTFYPVASNQFSVSFSTHTGSQLAGTINLGRLQFTTAAQTNSAIVPLVVSDLTGIQNDGRTITASVGNSGRVIVVIREPVMEIILYGSIGVNVYCLTNHAYMIEVADDLTWPISWYAFAGIAKAKRVETVIDPSFYSKRFYRTRDLTFP